MALLLTLGLGYVASRHKAAQDAILDEQQRLLQVKTSLSRIERQVLLARNDESMLLLKGGAGPIEGFQERMCDVDRGWRQLEANAGSAEVAGELQIVQETIRRYQSAVRTSIAILQQLGRAGEPGLLEDLLDAEDSLEELFQRLGAPGLSLRFSNLRLRQRDFSNSLNIEHAEALLRDAEALSASVEERPRSALTAELLGVVEAYRDAVFKAMSGVLELELASSQSSLRFGRVSPEIRGIEGKLDESLQATARRLQARREASLVQSALMIAGVFLSFLLLMVFEMRRAQAWIALESRLQQAQKLESLAVLTGGIAHDFNNLLTGILGHAQLALGRLSAGSTVRRQLEPIETAAKRAAELIRQMMAYAGQGHFVFEACDLGDLVEEMIRLLETAISKKARLRLSRDAEPAAVEADATQIRQVVMNLITNASDALGDRQGTIDVRIGIVEIAEADLSQMAFDHPPAPGRFVSLEVADDGCGMDDETRQRIFEPFFTTKRKGRGLGMAAVLGIIRAHRGAIAVDSRPGRGTTFRVLLPATSRRVESQPEGRPMDLARREGQGTVMVVDDDEVVRVLAHGCLREAGFEVLVAADGPSAVRLFAQHADRVEVVLLDMSMPGLDGEETFLELRRIRPEVRVIFSSGHPEEKVIARIRGLAGFLEKPYGPDLLLNKIFDVLDPGPTRLLPSSETADVQPAEASGGGGGTILLVDDERIVRLYATAILEHGGFDVLIAEDGLHGLEIFSQRAGEIDLVMLDSRMPRMGGAQALHELRRLQPDVKVILCSGDSEQKATDGVDGLAGFIRKPFEEPGLLQTVYEVLGRSHPVALDQSGAASEAVDSAGRSSGNKVR